MVLGDLRLFETPKKSRAARFLGYGRGGAFGNSKNQYKVKY